MTRLKHAGKLYNATQTERVLECFKILGGEGDKSEKIKSLTALIYVIQLHISRLDPNKLDPILKELEKKEYVKGDSYEKVKSKRRFMDDAVTREVGNEASNNVIKKSAIGDYHQFLLISQQIPIDQRHMILQYSKLFEIVEGLSRITEFLSTEQLEEIRGAIPIIIEGLPAKEEAAAKEAKRLETERLARAAQKVAEAKEVEEEEAVKAAAKKVEEEEAVKAAAKKVVEEEAVKAAAKKVVEEAVKAAAKKVVEEEEAKRLAAAKKVKRVAAGEKRDILEDDEDEAARKGAANVHIPTVVMREPYPTQYPKTLFLNKGVIAGLTENSSIKKEIAGCKYVQITPAFLSATMAEGLKRHGDNFLYRADFAGLKLDDTAERDKFFTEKRQPVGATFRNCSLNIDWTNVTPETLKSLTFQVCTFTEESINTLPKEFKFSPLQFRGVRKDAAGKAISIFVKAAPEGVPCEKSPDNNFQAVDAKKFAAMVAMLEINNGSGH